MFTKINYLKMPYQELQLYLALLGQLLDRMAKGQTNMKVNGESFRKEFAPNLRLLEQTFLALQHFKQSKGKSNKFLRALYGC